MHDPQELLIPVSNGELFCKVIGSGTPLLVIHGGAGFMVHDYLLPWFAQLAENYQVILYDQKGLGKSSSKISSEQINVKVYIEDIETIRNYFRLEKISILGHSWGGFLAMQYAISYSNSIDKLILMGTQPASSDDLQLFFDELAKRLAPFQKQREAIESSEKYIAGDPETVVELQKMIFRTYLFNPDNAEKLNLWKSTNAVLNGFKVWELFKSEIFASSHNIFGQLTNLTCPALIIHGKQDIIPIETAERIHSALPSSKMISLDHCGHFPFIETPEIVFQVLDEFLQK